MTRNPPSHLRVVGHSDPAAETDTDPVMTIDCEQCVRRYSDECDDCVVSYLVDHDPAVPVAFGRQEQKAVDLLADAGLIPRSRFQRDHGVA